MGIKVKAGDVFLIPLDQTTSAGGIIISDRKGELYIAVFQERLDWNEPDTRKIVNGKPLFLTLTLDAKLWHGFWPIIGNELKLTTMFPQPVYKVQYEGKIHMESRDRKFHRIASANEAEKLDFRTVSYPAVIEDAAKGKFGIVEWNPHYDSLLADYAIKSSKFLPLRCWAVLRQYTKLKFRWCARPPLASGVRCAKIGPLNRTSIYTLSANLETSFPTHLTSIRL